MGVLTKYVDVLIWNTNIKHYKNKGYKLKIGEHCLIKFEDMPYGSNYIIDLECDYCGEKFQQSINTYYHSIKTIDKCCCQKCQHIKQEEIMVLKYGIRNCTNLESAIEKKKKTNLEKYGHEFSIASKMVRDRIKETVQEKYGVDNVLSSNIVREKIHKANMEIYGVENPFQSKEVLDRMFKIQQEKYGDKFWKRITSKNQKHICELLNGKLNVKIDKYFADIIIQDNIIIEYDGGGHDLSVKLGQKTQKQFDKDERIRENLFINKGYKIIRLKPKYRDKIPNDEILLQIINNGIEKLENEDIIKILI